MDDEAMQRRFVEAVLQTCRAENARALAAALSLLAAVPPERRAAVGARLLKALGYEPATATMVLLSFEDVWRLIVEATPQRIRDAVMEGME